jgi:L-fuconolactonase
MRIDAHQHFWQVARGDYGWLTREAFPALYRDYLPSDLRPLLACCEIDRTILVQGAQSVAESEFLLDLAAATSFVAGVVGWVDLAASDAPEQISRLAMRGKLVGLRPMLQDLADDAWILRQDIAPAIEALQRYNLRFDALVFPRHLGNLRRFIDLYPDLPVVIDHGAKPYIARGDIEDWAHAMRAIANSSRTVCKLSGLATEASPGWTSETLKPYVDVLLEVFGPDRLMWGSDWPVVNVAGSYTGWFDVADSLTAQLSESERVAIFGGTAARFYGVAG